MDNVFSVRDVIAERLYLLKLAGDHDGLSTGPEPIPLSRMLGLPEASPVAKKYDWLGAGFNGAGNLLKPRDILSEFFNRRIDESAGRPIASETNKRLGIKGRPVPKPVKGSLQELREFIDRNAPSAGNTASGLARHGVAPLPVQPPGVGDFTSASQSVSRYLGDIFSPPTKAELLKREQMRHLDEVGATPAGKWRKEWEENRSRTEAAKAKARSEAAEADFQAKHKAEMSKGVDKFRRSGVASTAKGLGKTLVAKGNKGGSALLSAISAARDGLGNLMTQDRLNREAMANRAADNIMGGTALAGKAIGAIREKGPGIIGALADMRHDQLAGQRENLFQSRPNPFADMGLGGTLASVPPAQGLVEPSVASINKATAEPGIPWGRYALMGGGGLAALYAIKKWMDSRNGKRRRREDEEEEDV